MNDTQTIYDTVFSCQTRDEKKQVLKELSNTAKMAIELGTTEAETVNEFVINLYRNEEHQEFNTFKGWKKLGYTVKKGSKGFFVWSKKRTGTEKATNPNEDDKEFKFFSLAYLFSNAQVELTNAKKDA